MKVRQLSVQARYPEESPLSPSGRRAHRIIMAAAAPVEPIDRLAAADGNLSRAIHSAT